MTQYVLENYITLDPFLVEYFGVSKAPQVRKAKREKKKGDQETRHGVPEFKQSTLRYFSELCWEGMSSSHHKKTLLEDEARCRKHRSTLLQASFGTSPVRSYQV